MATKVVYVAGVALEDADGRILLAQRPEGKAMAGMWEFPGGKLEPGELPEHALCRELAEELAITLTPSDLSPLNFVSHAYDGFHLVMFVFHASRWQGVPTPQEGQDLRWVARTDLLEYLNHTPPADIPLLRQLAA